MSLFLSFFLLLVNHSENLTFLDCRLVMMNTPFSLILNGYMSFNWQSVFPMKDYMKIWQLSCVISKTLMMRSEINFHKKMGRIPLALLSLLSFILDVFHTLPGCGFSATEHVPACGLVSTFYG